MIKTLKYFRFTWDEETKDLEIESRTVGEVRLPKPVLYSLNRFLIRIFAKEGRRKRVKKTEK